MIEDKDSLYDIVRKKKLEIRGITCNPTMDSFDLTLCKELDSLADTDSFIKDRVYKTMNELKLSKGIDYNDHYKSSFSYYSEAVCYYLLKQKGFNVMNIPETTQSTPDFKVSFNCTRFDGKDEEVSILMEMKSLAFSNNNKYYKEVQNEALKAEIDKERQRKKGRKLIFADYCVRPFGDAGMSLTSSIEKLIEKISNNIKKEQFSYGGEKIETILLVDLSQYFFPFGLCNCLPIYPNINMKCCVSGILWMVVFGCKNERIYTCCEFDGKENFDNDLGVEGIFNDYSYIKGIIFCSGTSIENKKSYGFYRYKDGDSDSAEFIRQFCDFYNDDKNTKGFIYFEERPIS